MATDPNDPTTTEAENQPIGVDRVQQVSTNSDGTADQTDGYEVIEEEEAAGGDPDAAPQVSGAALQPEGEATTTTRRRRKANVEEATER